MYVPEMFEETRVDVMHALIRAHPFATLVTVGEGGPVANHLPFHLDAAASPLGLLRGHVARGNPLWRECEGAQALVVFQGPHAYVSPSWYPSKQAHGKVVPTWNYAVVHATGTISVTGDLAELRAHVGALTDSQESGRPDAWAVDDAPDEFVGKMLGGIRGLAIRVSGLTGKWKMSQNRGAEDRAGAVAGLRASGTDAALAVAAAIRPAKG